MATVDFSFQEFWATAAQIRGGQARARDAREIYALLEATGARRSVENAMEAVNLFFDGHGIEGIRVEGAWVDNYNGDIVASYVNMGDTYNLTLVHDSAQNSFHLTTYGNWLEAYEREHPPEGNCTRCGERDLMQNLDADTGYCERCRDAVAAEEAAEVTVGRPFDVWVAHRITDRDGNRHLVRAWWQQEFYSTGEELGAPELQVRVSSVHRGPLTTTADRLETGILYAGRGVTWLDSGFRLSRESIDRALVEMDAFLEGGR